MFTIFKCLSTFHRYFIFWNIQISQVMTSNSTEFWLAIVRKDVSEISFLTLADQNFVTMATYQLSDHPDIKSFVGHLWCSVLIFAPAPSSTWSSKHINVRLSLWPFQMFFEYKFTKYNVIRLAAWKWVSCHRNQIFYSSMCVACRTITLPTFNGLC